MVEPYVGEIRIFAGSFAPAGWRFCDGKLLVISEYEKLFNLIGTTYGGDGQITFALPDLRGRLPLHQGNGVNLAETGGAEAITLTVNQIPAHTHPLLATAAGANSTNPNNNVLAKPSKNMYSDGPGSNPMNPQSVGPTGGSQPDNNFQPYLCLAFIISLFGIFPSQT
jgi:microcystin-dependent protein